MFLTLFKIPNNQPTRLTHACITTCTTFNSDKDKKMPNFQILM